MIAVKVVMVILRTVAQKVNYQVILTLDKDATSIHLVSLSVQLHAA